VNTAVLTPNYQQALNEELDQIAQIDIDKDTKNRVTSKEEIKQNL